MGFEIAKAAANLGAEVILIAGPTSQTISHNLIETVNVVSAAEMYDATHKYYSTVDIAILSAAVADYRPKFISDTKIKKKDASFSIELEKTQDILKSLGEQKKHQFLVGFALETDNEIENAKSKLESKNLDLIVLNSLKDEGAGFGGSTNKVTFMTKQDEVIHHDLKSKAEVAQDILNQILNQIHA